MSRHLKIAFIVAPFLAIGGYALVDQYQHYQLQKQAKALYPLRVAGACRLTPEGGCLLRSDTLEVRLKTVDVKADGSLTLLLQSSLPLEGGKLGYGRSGEAVPQRSLRRAEDARHWLVSIPASDLTLNDRLDLRMVLVGGERVYLAEVEAAY